MPEDKHLLIVTRQACLDCETIPEIKGLIQIISLVSFYIVSVVFIAEANVNLSHCNFS